MNTSFEDAMGEVHGLFEGERYELSLECSSLLAERLRGAPILDAQQLGWAVYYQLRNMHALGRHDDGVRLLRSSDFELSQIAPRNEAWMHSVGAEMAARLDDAQQVVAWGERCYQLRVQTGDVRSQVMCCRTMCLLLRRCERPDLSFDFARELARLGHDLGDSSLIEQAVAFAREAGRELRRDARPMVYEPFDAEQSSLAGRTFRRLAQGLDRSEAFTVHGFERFSVLMQLGFEDVSYASYRLDDGAMYWITDAHAAAIGGALAPALRSFHLALTCFEGNGFERMAEHVSEVHLDRLVVNHRSGDEVTVDEARGLAAFVTATRAHTLSLWAGEFEPGALDELAESLTRLGNTSLCALDICDTTRDEPDDRIEHAALEALTAANSRRPMAAAHGGL